MGFEFFKRLKAQPALFVALLLLSFGQSIVPFSSPMLPEAEAQRYAEFLPDDFVLFWPSPVRAHPNVPLRFRFSVYEMYNQPLTWRLTNAPQGMAVSSDGRVTWTPTGAQAGNYTVTVRVTRFDGAFRERTFPVTVNTTSFAFVSTTGSDTNPGTLAQPYRTILKALQSTTNGIGKTIYIRGGTYRETYNWEVNGVISPLRAKNFSAENPLEIVGYPDEAPVLDCQFQGHGMWFYKTSFVVLDNLTVINANAPERGGIVVTDSDNILIRDSVVHGSNWSYTANCSGFIVSSTNTVLDGTIGYDNRDPSSDSWNSANFLFYLNQTGAGDAIYVIGAKAWGSVAGFKIKHAGPKRLIIHKSEAFDHTYGYVLASAFSSVRYSTSLNNYTGVQIGIADTNPYTVGAILVDHNTLLNSVGTAFNLQDGYSTASPSVLTNNIFMNTLRAAGNGEYDGRLMQLWMYDNAAESRPIISDHNLFYSSSESNIVRLGTGGYKGASFSAWRSLGHDPMSVFRNPLYANLPQGNISLPATSPASFADGTYVGSLRPGLSTSLIGVRTASFPPAPPSGVRVQQTN